MRAAAAGIFLASLCLVAGPVWAQGAPPSEDESGVAEDEGDDEDEDNDTPEPLPALTARGRIVVQADPLFQGASPELSERGYELVRSIRAAMAGFTGKVTVTVHWSTGGTREWTLGATKRRAEALANYIVGIGIPASRVVAVGRGFDLPVASNDSPEGQAANRRVEIVSDSRAKLVAPAPAAKPAPEAEPAPTPAPKPAAAEQDKPARTQAPAPRTPAPNGSATARVEAKLQQAVGLAERLRDSVKRGAADCAAVSGAVIKWSADDDKPLEALGDEITDIFDHELNYQYTPAHRQLLTRYSQAMAAAIASLEACGEAGGLTPAALAAIDAMDAVNDLLYEPRGVNADPLCRRLSELERDVREDPARLKGAPIDGGFASKRGLPDTTCEYSGGGVMCEVGRYPTVVEAAETYVAMETRISACHFSREESEMDRLHHRPGARNQRVWLHTGMPGRSAVTCLLRLVPTMDGGVRTVLVVDRARF
ncbi:MAG: OmpA family protein [Myxococcota bacterium]